MRIALYQPDIAPNAGAIFRLASVLGVDVDLIGPAGFVMTDKKLRRVAMDYFQVDSVFMHTSWREYLVFREGLPENNGRMVLLTTLAHSNHIDFSYREADTLLVGRETAGVPTPVHRHADARVRIPMLKGKRSLNVVVAAAIVIGEAFRQTNLWNNLSD